MRNRITTLLFACMLCIMGWSQTETVLFNSNSTKKYPYRIPAIATMSNGEIIAISDYRPGGKDVGNGTEVDIYARISNNNGATWSGDDNTPHDNTYNIIKVADGSSTLAFGDAAVAAHPETGEVLVMCVGAGSTPFSQADEDTKDYYCYRFYSKDYGQTWNPDDTLNITNQMKGEQSVLPNKNVYAMFFASGRLHVSRYHKNRIYGALLTKEQNGTCNYVLYTEDFGKTWTCLGNEMAIGNSANEAKVEELPNGDVLISSRKSGGRYFNVYSFGQGNWLGQEEYTFGGSNDTNGELLLYNSVKKANDANDMKEYALLLQSLPIGSNRSNVAIFYKLLEYGTTYTAENIASEWTKGKIVYESNSAYSTMTIMPNGEIGFLYEKDYYSSNIKDNFNLMCAAGGTANIVFVPFAIEDVTGKACNKVDKTSLTIGPTGYATFFSPYAVNIPEEVTAKYVDTEKNHGSTGALEYTDLKKVIPANTAVVLKGEPGKYDLTVAYGTANVTDGNALFGYAADILVTSNDNIYALANKNKKVAFYPYGGEIYKAGKAYLNVNRLMSGTEVRSFALFDEVTETGVENVLEVMQQEGTTKIYDLNGRVVQKPGRGIYIVNGKKVLR